MQATDKAALPPGSRLHWLWGNGPRQVKDALGQFVCGHQRHGDVVYFHLFEGPAFLLCHPEHAQRVMVDNARNYRFPGPEAGFDGPLMGRGLFASRGDYWMRQRRMVQPAFHRPRLGGMVNGLVEGTLAMVERWEPRLHSGQPLDLLEEMRHLSISLLGRTIFSRDVYEENAPLREALDFFTHDSHGPRDSLVKVVRQLLRLRPGHHERFMGAVEKMNTVLYALIAERRAAPSLGDDVLGMLMSARDAQGEAMTDRQVRDELVSLFVGGQEATAVALTWTWYALARNPQVEQRVRQELADVLGGNLPTSATLQELHYTRATVEETLRLHPPSWQFARKAREADEIGGWKVPPGMLMLISPYILHRHPSAWEDPERFMPERFMGEQRERRAQRIAYMPFGAGQRLCIGNHFTPVLMTAALAVTLRRFQHKLVSDLPIVTMSGSTYRPRNGLMATLHPAS
ncbi:cytochrome P450 [Corallococcus exiguus]|uniref:cytochrome P450 n=1 Tax=Corallococcus exiguus TaxID=83462 RepID=UPI001A8EF3F2|nr:cytochrome P450 [Corallococcus exiguus]MBN8468383.1 cytochrome P450 [Corallococcus exiguus]